MRGEPPGNRTSSPEELDSEFRHRARGFGGQESDADQRLRRIQESIEAEGITKVPKWLVGFGSFADERARVEAEEAERARRQKMRRLENRRLKRIVDRLCECLAVKQIIQTGTSESEEVRPERGFDLLVELEEDQHSSESSSSSVALRQRSYPVQLTVLTPSDWERQRYVEGSIVNRALWEGRLLYSRRRGRS